MSFLSKLAVLSTAGASVGVDPDAFYDQAILQMHGDGTNGSTSFVDSSTNGFSVSVTGNAQINTSIKKFGTGSMKFDGSGDYLTLPSGFDTAFGGLAANQFTIEAWIYPNTVTPSQWMGFIGPYQAVAANGRWVISVTSGSNIGLSYTTSTGSQTNVTSTQSVTASQWTHVAVTVDATTATNATVTIYVNGVGTTYTGQNMSTHTSVYSPTTIGGNHSIYYDDFNGYVDELRIVKGAIVYTGDFTPLEQAFSDQ